MTDTSTHESVSHDSAGAPRPGRVGRLADRTSSFALILAALGVTVAFVGGLLGFRPYAIRSGSMTPALQVGDLIINRPELPMRVHPRDVVTFIHPTLHESVTHRVVTVRQVGDEVEFITKGDANTSSESWRVPVDSHVGHMVLSVPRAGFAIRLFQRWMPVCGIVIFAIYLGVVLLRRIWRVPAVKISD